MSVTHLYFSCVTVEKKANWGQFLNGLVCDRSTCIVVKISLKKKNTKCGKWRRKLPERKRVKYLPTLLCFVVNRYNHPSESVKSSDPTRPGSLH